MSSHARYLEVAVRSVEGDAAMAQMMAQRYRLAWLNMDKSQRRQKCSDCDLTAEEHYHKAQHQAEELEATAKHLREMLAAAVQSN